jgi:hypothetical protein
LKNPRRDGDVVSSQIAGECRVVAGINGEVNGIVPDVGNHCRQLGIEPFLFFVIQIICIVSAYPSPR